MDATLTKDALIEMIRDKVGYPVKEAKEILEIILEEVKLKLEEGKEVKISGFGKWTVKEKRSRPGRNPHTGDRIEISGPVKEEARVVASGGAFLADGDLVRVVDK